MIIAGYNWYYNTLSVSNTSQKDIKQINVYKLLNSCYEELGKRKILKKNFELIEAYFIKYIYWFITFSTINCNYKTIKKEYNNLFDWLKQRFPSYKKNNIIGINKPKEEPFRNRILYSLLKIFDTLNIGYIFVYIYNKIKKIKIWLRIRFRK